jgi:DNA repair protein SbcD/Mre11
VSPGTFEGFDFVALGHLHRPQSVGSDRIQYSGSLLKYSFDEAAHRKSVSIVDLGADGAAVVTRVQLAPRHDVRVVEGTLRDLIEHPDATLPRDDYISARLMDEGPVLGAIDRLREVYPNVLEVQRVLLEASGDPAARSAGDHRRREPDDLFRAFYRDVVGEDIDEPALEVFGESVRSLGGAAGEGAR